MKIAMIGHKRIPSREGGIEIVVEELSRRMVEEGHRVYVYNRAGHHISGKEFDNEIKRSSKSLKTYKGINIIGIPTLNSKRFNALIYSLLSTLRAIFGGYDVIHYHAEGPSAMLWLPHILGIRIVVTIHGLDWKRAKWGGFAARYLKLGEKLASKYADEVIVLSKNVKQYFLDTYGRETNYIPNGIVRPQVKEAATIGRRWKLQKNSYILFLARIVPEKGLHYLVEAFKAIPTSKKLVIAGGSSHTDKYYSEIKQKAGNDERFIFTGFIQGDELTELFSNAYLYVLPSDLEGMPLSLLEAMSYGNCCLVSNICECIEVVGEKGVSFNRGDIDDLKKKLIWLIKNPELVKKYKAEAADYICQRYNWNAIVKDTLKLYKEG